MKKEDALIFEAYKNAYAPATTGVPHYTKADLDAATEILNSEEFFGKESIEGLGNHRVTPRIVGNMNEIDIPPEFILQPPFTDVVWLHKNSIVHFKILRGFRERFAERYKEYQMKKGIGADELSEIPDL